jgi:hypothetical protein
MSQMMTLPSLELLLIAGRAVALVLGLLIFAWAFRHWRRAAMRDTQRVFEQLDLVRSELLIMKEVMHHTTHRDGHRDGHREGQRDSQNETGHRESFYRDSGMRNEAAPRSAAYDTRLAVAAVSGAARGYENAARMARNGASKEELMRSCGVTSHEAELLVKLHGQRQAAGAELIGRQPRTVEPTTDRDTLASTLASTNLARQQSSAQVLQNQPRQAANPLRQNAAAMAAQRTPAAPIKAQNLPPRSRLVAVG